MHVLIMYANHAIFDTVHNDYRWHNGSDLPNSLAQLQFEEEMLVAGEGTVVTEKIMTATRTSAQTVQG